MRHDKGQKSRKLLVPPVIWVGAGSGETQGWGALVSMCTGPMEHGVRRGAKKKKVLGGLHGVGVGTSLGHALIFLLSTSKRKEHMQFLCLLSWQNLWSHFANCSLALSYSLWHLPLHKKIFSLWHMEVPKPIICRLPQVHLKYPAGISSQRRVIARKQLCSYSNRENTHHASAISHLFLNMKRQPTILRQIRKRPAARKWRLKWRNRKTDWRAIGEFWQQKRTSGGKW